MSVPSQHTTFTPEDLLHVPDGKSFELVHGQLVEKNMGFESSFVGLQLSFFLVRYCYSKGLGWVLPADASYQCFADDPTKVRKPDVSFIQASRLAASQRPTGHCQIAPDLAVEVVSPNDLFEDVSRKVDEYLAAGVRLVWVIDPKAERVFIYRHDESATILTNKDSLDGEDVVPGFLCAIADLFKPPAGVEAE
ncbi:MAG: Uma2 family endonuclease [Planctomycetaceae bacterium]|nr:Uma2 family endonuclease [Planctomycetales bacterium]MCB9875750.1 Uma2 family endonuclease [Planctomycetaceae bacterium]MCB9936887.1 Uma2 family endonuclease [Planctomycetaceae bacterium]